MERKTICVTNLFLDLDNFRFEHQNSQRDAINQMVEAYHDELYQLAVDILNIGLNPMDSPYVIPHPTDEKKYIVIEGNRRITTLKLLLNPKLIDDSHLSLRKKFIKLKNSHADKLIHRVDCGVFPSRDEGNFWVVRKHANGLKGIGTKQWTSLQKQRFDKVTTGKEAYALQVINMLNASSFVDDDFKTRMKKLNVTNLQRLLADPAVREKLGLALQNGRLVSDLKPEVLTKSFVDIISEMLTPSFKVGVIYSKSDRADYISKLFERIENPNIPENKVVLWELQENQEIAETPKFVDSTIEKKVSTRKTRATLVPKSFHLPITESRIAKIFKEMSGLLVKTCTNTAAILLRIFIEMSVDVYMEQFNLLPVGVQTASQSKLNLHEKLKRVIEHLHTSHFANKDMTKGIEMEISDRNSPLSPQTLNAYIHNYRISPIADNLIIEWDNIQPFFECLWGAISKKEETKS